MLTSFTWVPKGAMKTVPLHTTDTAEQVREKLRRLNPEADEEAAMQGVNMEDSDEDAIAPGVGGGNDGILEQIESDDESEIDDTTFKDTDLVFVTTKAEKDEPTLELYTYDEPVDNVYMHHDAPVAGFPLCSAWLTDGEMSLLALGTMMPFIEIWPLDVIDAVDPVAVLGGCKNVGDNYRRKLKKSLLQADSHQDAVLTAKWNVNASHILVTGSADDTIKLWDLNDRGCVGTYNEGAKVQTLGWHPSESNLLLSGSFDGSVVLRDCRRPDEAAIRWSHADVVEHVEVAESGTEAVASLSNGMMYGYELRMNSNPLWEVQAHEAETTFSLSMQVPGLIATGGADSFINLWRMGGDGGAPEQLSSHKFNSLGHVMSVAWHPNSPHILGACGAKGMPLVYTVTNDVPGMAEIAGVPVTVDMSNGDGNVDTDAPKRPKKFKKR